jgi:hypothetical protein
VEERAFSLMSLTFGRISVLEEIVIPRRSRREATGAWRDLAFRPELRLFVNLHRSLSPLSVLFGLVAF